jgi:hypothetical protein
MAPSRPTSTPAPDRRRSRSGAADLPETEIAQIIDGRRPFPAHGSPEMPIWERFVDGAPSPQAKQASSRGQVILFVAYLRSIQQK